METVAEASAEAPEAAVSAAAPGVLVEGASEAEAAAAASAVAGEDNKNNASSSRGAGVVPLYGKILHNMDIFLSNTLAEGGELMVK